MSEIASKASFTMNALLSKVLDAHGGLDRLEALHRGNGEHRKRRRPVRTQRPTAGSGSASHDGLAAPAARLSFRLARRTSAPCSRRDRIAIEKLDGALVAERYAPRDPLPAIR